MPNPAPKRVFVLTVMDARNHAELKLCLKSKRFRLLNQAEEEALEYLRKHRISAVVYDNDFGHNHWRGFFDKTRKINDRPPKVIVASRNADERFWIEVLNVGSGDIDVLAKPFYKEELYIVESMDRHWRHPGGRPKRQ